MRLGTRQTSNRRVPDSPQFFELIFDVGHDVVEEELLGVIVADVASGEEVQRHHHMRPLVTVEVTGKARQPLVHRPTQTELDPLSRIPSPKRGEVLWVRVTTKRLDLLIKASFSQRCSHSE